MKNINTMLASLLLAPSTNMQAPKSQFSSLRAFKRVQVNNNWRWLILLGILGLAGQSSALAQTCLPSGITFSTQAQIDGFATDYPGCTAIEGAVSITGNDITNLDGLIDITSIGGALTISGNPLLTSLSGLENLTSVGDDLFINNNANLSTLIGLDNLQVIDGTLDVNTNAGLLSLNGLGALNQISGGFGVFANVSLINLGDLGSLSSIGADLFIANNAMLSSLDNLTNLSSIDGGLYINTNPSLTNLNGLYNLFAINGGVFINNNANLFDLSGLENLNTIGGTLDINNNPTLSNLDGLVNLNQIFGGFGIYENGSLANLSGLGNLNSIGIDLYVASNASLPSLNGLLSLGSIGGGLYINDNDLLTTIGLASLNYIGGELSVQDNAILPSLDGMGFISNFYGNVLILRNPLLTNLAGLANATSIGGDLRISFNDALPNLNDLGNLTYVGAALNFARNPLLTSLSGLDNLEAVGGFLAIQTDSALTSLSGLESLQTIGGFLLISGNPVLTSLSGMDNVTSIGTDLYITNNAALATCAITPICQKLAFPNGATIQISSNAPASNCTNQAAVEAVCNFVPICPTGDITFSSQAQIDNFPIDYPGCTEIMGNVAIQGADITNLNGLSAVTSIGGYLFIGFNTNLADLNGLSALANVSGNLTVMGNAALTSLGGMSNLNTVGGNLSVRQNATLQSIGTENLASINGELEISENNALTTLGNLQNLNVLNGDLRLTTNPSLSSLGDLSGLSAIGGNITLSSVGLEDMSGLDNVTSIDGYLDILSCPSLTTLSGLGNLQTIGQGMLIISNNALTGFGDLSALTAISSDCDISSNASLNSLAGLGNLTSIGGSFNLSYNSSLTSLSGLDALTSIGGYLALSNTALGSLSGLGSLASIGGYLLISDNLSLTNLTALSNLNIIDGNLTILNNASLSDCDITAVCDKLANPNGATIQISNNAPASDCTDQAAVEAVCNFVPVCPTGDITFSSQAQIDNFPIDYPGCTEITGNVTITGADITNLDGLASVALIGGFLKIFNNPNLTSISGLSSLTSVGGSTTIEQNLILPTLSGLENLTTIGGLLRINSCNTLSNMEGLDGLTSIAGICEIFGNTSIINLAGLENLQSIGGQLWIGSNPNLLSLNGLSGLAELPGGLVVQWNDLLPNLNGLENITSVNNLAIAYNPVLTSLSGINNLNSIAIDLFVHSNFALTNLNGLNNLTSIGRDCWFGINGITNLNGLGSITMIGRDFTLAGNNSLTSLSGISSLPHIGGTLAIFDNAALPNLNGLENLTSIAGALYLRANAALASLSGLENLSSIGRLEFENNPSLASLSALSNLTTINGDWLSIVGPTALTNLNGLDNVSGFTNLYIQSNLLLSDCAIAPVCDKLANPNGSIVFIHNNAPCSACFNQIAVVADCNNSPYEWVSCPAAQTLILDENCSVAMPNYTTLAATANNCQVLNVTQSPAVGATVSGTGDMTVTLTVEYTNYPNTSCSFTVTKVDNTPPSITCLATQTLVLGSACTASLPNYTSLATTSDNCGVQSVSQSPAAGTTVSSAGDMSVTLTVTDINGLTNTCSFTVTKVDNTPPSITCPATQTLVLGSACTASLPDYTGLATTADNCGVQSVSQSPAAGTTVSSAGDMSVTLTVTDINGLTNTCSFTVTKVDNTPPSITCPATQTLVLGSACTASLPDYTGLATTADNCGVQSVSQSPAAGTTVSSAGDMSVTLTVTDINGLTNTCTFTVTKVDNTPPSITCPATQTLVLGSACTASLPDYTGLATTSDNCGVQSVSQSPAAGTTVSSAGDMSVTLTVTDINGLTNTCSFTVSKVDNTPPSITCPATQTLVLGSACTASLPDYTGLATTADNCGVQSVSQSPAAGTTVSGAGNMSATLTVTDINGLTNTCTFTVTKVDNTPPSITCPATQTLVLGSACTASLPDYTGLATTSDNCGVQSVSQSPAVGTTVSGAGNMSVTLTVTDINGLTNTCSFTVTKVDNTPPSITCPATQTLVLGSACTASLPDYTGLATTSDNCGVQSVSQSPAAGTTVSSAGDMSVTLTVTDINGLTNTCSFTVSKVDNTPPSITCPATQTLVLGSACTASLPDYTGLATTADNCGVQSVSQSPAAGTTVSGAGNMSATLTVTDINGLTNTCTFTVTKVDNTPPSITCPATQTLVLGSACTASLPDYTGLATTSDNCGVQSVSQSPAVGTTVSGAGNMSVTLTVTDINGLTNTCSFTVTKVDNTPPSITCPATQTLVLGSACTASLPDYTGLATTADNCGLQSVSQSPAAGTTVSSAGDMSVTLTVTDINGLTNTCSFTVTKVDNTPPSITCPATQTLVLGSACTASLPDYTGLATTADNCGVQSVSQSPAAGTTVSSAGDMSVTLTVTDINGLTNTCSFTVTKVDNTPPSITCPATQMLVLGSACTASLPDYTGLATTADNCGVQSVSQSPAAGTTVSSAGDMSVTLTVTDINGLTNTCTFTVTKVDNTPPSITCPATQTLVLGSACTASLPDYTGLATTSDNCGVQSVSQSPAAGTTVSSAGDMSVTLTVTDINGLTNTCSFTVTKVDNTPPSITCPATQTLVLGSSCTASLPNYTSLATTSDNCGVQSVSQSPAAGTTISDAGNMSVTLTVTDINGLTNTCSFTVTKVDNTPPSITCPATQTLVLGSACTASLPDYTGLATTADNCGVQSVSQSPAAGTTVSSAGDMSVTLTVTDINGLTNTCSFTVTKVDNTPPSITCPATQTLVLGSSCTASLPNYTSLATTSDNCGVQSVSQSPAAGTTVSGAGNMSVTLTVTDINGLTNTCSFTVTKVDNTPPSITCPTAQILMLGTNNTAVLPNYTGLASASDNCGVQSISQSPVAGTIVSGAGDMSVTLTVTDVNGLSNTCQFTVKKTANVALSINCPSTQTLALGANCTTVLPDYTSLAIIEPSTGIQSVMQSPAAGTPVANVGEMTVTLTVTDVNGNMAQCAFMVSKVDNTPPTVQCLNPTVVFNGQASITLSSAQVASISDNCGLQPVVLSPASIQVSQLGQTIPVMVTTTDINGNSTNCTAQVTVTGLPSGWSQQPDGIGCAGGNAIAYNAATNVWTATSTNCYYAPPFVADAAGFAQGALCGNGSIIAQVASLNGNGWAGIMLRESNAPVARKVQLMTNFGNFSRREVRYTTGGQAYPQSFPSQGKFWLRLLRQGNQFIGYTSSDGVAWTQVFAVTIAGLPQCLQAGLVVTNGLPNSTVTATFAQVAIISNPSLSATETEDPGAAPLNLNVFPNPTLGEAHIDLSPWAGQPLALEIYDSHGRRVRHVIWEETTGAAAVDMTQLPAGLYLFRLSELGEAQPASKTVAWQKVLLQQ